MTTSMPPRRYFSRGFTLIELMIVVVVVALLASIAIPAYTNQVRETRRAEAQAVLVQGAQMLERCFTLHNTYNMGAVANPDPACAAGVPATSENGWYNVNFQVAATATTYTLRATPQGDQASDAACMNLTLTQAGQRGHSGTAADSSDCW